MSIVIESGQTIIGRMACYSFTKKCVTKMNILLHKILKNNSPRINFTFIDE